MAKRGPRTSPSQTPDNGQSRKVRCAIYTRKSTDEGLDQAFNSLDAQREACAAYVLSQQHEGWILQPELYDDGGFSGGTMERPALKCLLADIVAGRVDVIVVYKVDRLTRALSDFAKIVEVLDRHGASFVSVTQAFNTTSSMGRLTLNVLLSFAQFEREVTGERIRDKIAASKKKGMWMGGPVPLGYDVRERRLYINEAEAETVRLIFARHQKVDSLQALAGDLAHRGVRSKLRTMKDGRQIGGTPFSPGALSHLLRNRIYIGQVTHGDQVYPGEHEAILEQAAWDASQAILDGNCLKPRSGQVSLLAGVVRDAHHRRMGPAHAIKGGKRYRYYASQADAAIAEPVWRIPAGDLELMVTCELRKFLDDPSRVAVELGDIWVPVPRLAQRGQEIAARIDDPATCGETLRDLGVSIVIGRDQLDITIGAAALATMIMGSALSVSQRNDIHLSARVSLKRRGHELRLVYAAPESRAPNRDDRLIQLIASGRAAYRQLQSNTDPLTPVRRSHLTRLARLHFLAPDIVTAIIDGNHPVEISSRSLLRIADLPLDWAGQRRVLGFA